MISIETLVGELEEEKGPAEPADIEKLDENTWRIQGDTSLEDVAECFGVKTSDGNLRHLQRFCLGAYQAGYRKKESTLSVNRSV